MTGTLESAVPHMELGGVVERGGLAVLHEGEEVIPARVTRRREEPSPTEIHLHFYSPVTNREFVESEIIPVVEEAVERHLRRSE